MKARFLLPFLLLLGFSATLHAQTLDEKLPVRGLCISAPSTRNVDTFVRFINEELAPAKINLLILRVDWNYAFESHPELRDANPLTKADVDKLVNACKEHGIRLVPQINLLGHQSWAKETHNLLRVYPEFDETPLVNTENYSRWPNPDRLYCKSYCPLHPEVHKIVFELVDEICEAFQSDAFHAGMDEVFYIGEDQCPRCKGKNKAELFAGEVTTIHDHLALGGRQLMIWGDRLIDGRTTGLGEWEASYNDTWQAVDLIPKDVLICDWHYHRSELTPAYFATKGLPVVACGYNEPDACVDQIQDMMLLRSHAVKASGQRLQGYVHTIWSDSGRFLRAYYGQEQRRRPNDEAAAERPRREQSRDADALKAVLKLFREME